MANVNRKDVSMISKNALKNLVDDYDRAHKFVDGAAAILEDASVMVPSAGEEFTRSSSEVIGRTGDLCVEIRRIRDRLQDVTPDV
jgi:hypothetical protein